MKETDALRLGEEAAHRLAQRHQTDIVFYGMSLLDHVDQEFAAGPGMDRSDPRWPPEATVPFWRDLEG